MTTAFFLLGGLVLLFFGAEWLIRGSADCAVRAGVPSLVAGLTIVAFGTSAPELVVSVRAGFDGFGNIAVGNVIGSNIFNIAVIIGIAAIIRPLRINVTVLRIDTIILIGTSTILCFFVRDGTIGRGEGVILTAFFILYMLRTLVVKNRTQKPFQNNQTVSCITTGKGKPIFRDIIMIVSGFVLLLAGSRFFVRGSINLANQLGISEAVIGLTIVAAGTSLPELATSIMATVKGEEDIAVGNIIGSNIFNILVILGITGTLTPLSSPGIGPIDLAFMMGTAIVLVPLMKTGFRLVRTEGLFLVCIYALYLWYLWRK